MDHQPKNQQDIDITDHREPIVRGTKSFPFHQQVIPCTLAVDLVN